MQQGEGIRYHTVYIRRLHDFFLIFFFEGTGKQIFIFRDAAEFCHPFLREADAPAVRAPAQHSNAASPNLSDPSPIQYPYHSHNL